MTEEKLDLFRFPCVAWQLLAYRLLKPDRLGAVSTSVPNQVSPVAPEARTVPRLLTGGNPAIRGLGCCDPLGWFHGLPVGKYRRPRHA